MCYTVSKNEFKSEASFLGEVDFTLFLHSVISALRTYLRIISGGLSMSATSIKLMIVLAHGFEEIEAITAFDLAKRAGIDVKLFGVGGLEISGAHGLRVKVDAILEDKGELPDGILLPGGLPGAKNLADSSTLAGIIIKMHEQKKLIAAICAAPALVLAPLGILSGFQATCYPSFERSFSNDVRVTTEAVVCDRHIITSRGPATAFPFALAVVQHLMGRETADGVAGGTLFVCK